MVLSNRQQRIGEPLLEFESLDSTNQFAQELIAKSNPNEGTAVFTWNQTHGRGQIGRYWVSAPKENLTLSIILKPTFLKPRLQFYLTVISSLSLVRLLNRNIEAEIEIKWPNDIYIGHSKIAGILIQNILLGNQISYTIIGIGLNINQTKFNIELPNPISMSIVSGSIFNIVHVRQQLFADLQHFYTKLKVGKTSDLFSEYMSLLYLKNQEANYMDKNGNEFKGIIRGVQNDGMLMMDIGDTRENFRFNQFKYVL